MRLREIFTAPGGGDELLLQRLQPDAVLFVGDLSDGDLRLTRRIRSLPHPIAVILGNHDGAGIAAGVFCVSNSPFLMAFTAPGNGCDLIHCRCRSWGLAPAVPVGISTVQSGSGCLRTVSLEESVQRITSAAAEVPEDQPLVVMAHCGPTGLGSDRASPCGRDWKTPALDWGDQDLALALDRIARHRIPDLVVFGHMHHQLKRGSGLRQSLVRDRRGTAYLNAACVPRSGRDAGNQQLLHFSWAELRGQP